MAHKTQHGNPQKIHPTQGTSLYSEIESTNGVCADSIQQSINIEHPWLYTASDTFRHGVVVLVTFTNTPVTTIRNGIAT